LREAHAVDSAWPMLEAGVPVVEEPLTFDERRKVAASCVGRLDLAPIPALVDGLDDAVGRAYEAWPDRLYLIDAEGRVAYRGGPGPFGFDPEAWDAAIKAEIGAE
jgi:hypothetical protein